jgi:hypothetical protein
MRFGHSGISREVRYQYSLILFHLLSVLFAINKTISFFALGKDKHEPQPAPGIFRPVLRSSKKAISFRALGLLREAGMREFFFADHGHVFS